MSVKFRAENHSYESTVDEGIDWVSVTTFISHFKDPFDAKKVAERVAKSKKSKWYGMTPTEIQTAWTTEAKRSTDLGSWYHDQRESDLTSHDSIMREGFTLPIIKPIYEDGIKYAPDQKLSNGIYPEHFVFLKSAGLCGQSDLVEVVNGVVNIMDYKTNKEIKNQGFKNWDGITKKLSKPLSHLDDCNLIHYTIQLSLYMYMILKHNPKLKPGKLTLHHILFEEQDRDKFDNPVYRVDHQGNFVVKDTVPYEVPYLKSDCINLINWLKENRSLLKKKK